VLVGVIGIPSFSQQQLVHGVALRGRHHHRPAWRA
jgi:hypothetical protein